MCNKLTNRSCGNFTTLHFMSPHNSNVICKINSWKPNMNKLFLIVAISLTPLTAHCNMENPYLNSYYAGACYVLDELKKDNKEQAVKIKAFRDIDFYLTKCDEYTKSFKENYERYNRKSK